MELFHKRNPVSCVGWFVSGGKIVSVYIRDDLCLFLYPKISDEPMELTITGRLKGGGTVSFVVCVGKDD
jgi:hypothetical protein